MLQRGEPENPQMGDACRQARQEHLTALSKGDDARASPWKAVGGCVCVVGLGICSLAELDCVSGQVFSQGLRRPFDHADSLENLNITLHSNVKSRLQSMNRILTSCCNPRVLAIYYAADERDHDFPSTLCTSEPWKCTQLNTLYLDGFAMALITDDCEGLREYKDREKEFFSSHGWSVEIVPTFGEQGSLILKPVTGRIDSTAPRMPKL